MTFKESPDPWGCCTNPHSCPELHMEAGKPHIHRLDDWPVWPCFIIHAHRSDWRWEKSCVSVSRDILLMESPAALDGLESLTVAGQRQDILVHHHLEMNINMNEGADQPVGKTGSRRKSANTKTWTELKKTTTKKRETEETKPIWRVSINSSRWEKNRRRDTKSGGMNGGKQPAADKLTTLITSQHWPVLEVTFKVRTCVFLSILAPQNQVWTAAAVTGRKINNKDKEKK